MAKFIYLQNIIWTKHKIGYKMIFQFMNYPIVLMLYRANKIMKTLQLCANYLK